MEKIRFSISDILISKIAESDVESLSSFSCGDPELDEFFHDEAWLCHKYRYLITYKCVLKSTGEIVALFTIANDILKLEYQDILDYPYIEGEYSEIFRRQITYPAVNIGHLGVRSDLQSMGIGQCIVEFVQASFSRNTFSGCQFITVDALNNIRTLSFYEYKLGFEYLTLSDMGDHTRRMYLDIFSQPV